MKKVFIVHGYRSMPNGGWRPWLMGELASSSVYACALSMPDPDAPQPDAWVEEIARHVERNIQDEIYLVGHSLGVPAILRYLEKASLATRIAGAVLVSGPVERIAVNTRVDAFLEAPFAYETIRSKLGKVCVIHGDNDERVPLGHGEQLARGLSAELIVIPGGGHLNGTSGWTALPQVKEALARMGV